MHEGIHPFRPTMEVQDVVHGNITITHEVALIVLSAQFQRLRKIKQLGLLSLVVPFAYHTRYDHCIGTYYLCKRMLNALISNTEWLAKNPMPIIYRKAVEVAALLHDVGHGPFSHVWESISDGFCHEKNAIPCVDAIFASSDGFWLDELREEKNYGVELIKALILGDPSHLSRPLPEQYSFIFEIVNNHQCKLDVDKWDYLKRDHHYLKHMCDPRIDFDDIFLNARVSDDGKHIEYRYKDYDKIYMLFEARWSFHVNCYRMPKNIACDLIINDILKNCDCHINGIKLNQIDASNMPSFLQLTDDKVLNLLSLDKKFQYLKNINNIKQVDKSCPKTENSVVVEYVIKGPGEEMPSDDYFYFYGDSNEKEAIHRNSRPTKSITHFQLC